LLGFDENGGMHGRCMKAFHTTKVKPKTNSLRNRTLVQVVEIKARTNKNGAMVS
jgi:hypothetical protein